MWEEFFFVCLPLGLSLVHTCVPIGVGCRFKLTGLEVWNTGEGERGEGGKGGGGGWGEEGLWKRKE